MLRSIARATSELTTSTNSTAAKFSNSRYNVTHHSRGAVIEYLRDWMSKQPHLPSGVTDEQLILFLNCCKHSLEACKQTIEMYYTIRTHAPELFANRDTRRRELQQALSIIEIVAMPKRDQHGNLVMAGRVVDNNVSKFSYEETTKAWFMLQDVILLEEGAIPGFVFVLDASSAGMGHLARTSLSTVKKYYMYIQEAFPGIVIANHMVNAGPVIEAFINIGKPFMNKELASKIFIHSSFDTLHEHVTKDALPKEFGGNLDSLSSYSKITMAQFEKYRDWFKEEEALRVDESKRQGKAKNSGDVFGLEGSFQKLDID